MLKDVSFEGAGCAISTASASMMTESVKGKTRAEADALFDASTTWSPATRRAATIPALGKLAVFSGVSEFPVRVKCATLPWHTLKAALAGRERARVDRGRGAGGREWRSLTMQMRKEATVSRDVAAREIPSGTPITLRAGDPVVITQSLGGSYTVMTPVGFLARVDGKDADAIGEPVVEAAAAAAEGRSTDDLVWDQLRTCYDPEIPVNIVDLGLVYDCAVTDLPEGGKRADVKFTLTAPGCGMGDVLREDIKGKLLSVPDVKEADVQVVFDPPWSLQMMSDVAKLQLGMM